MLPYVSYQYNSLDRCYFFILSAIIFAFEKDNVHECNTIKSQKIMFERWKSPYHAFLVRNKIFFITLTRTRDLNYCWQTIQRSTGSFYVRFWILPIGTQLENFSKMLGVEYSLSIDVIDKTVTNFSSASNPLQKCII